MSLHSNDKIYQKYLNAYCSNISNIIYSCCVGVVQKNIDIEKFKNISIPLPSLKDQEAIVQQMEKYDELVKLQQAQIDKIDKTIKARFEFYLNKCKETKTIEEQQDNLLISTISSKSVKTYKINCIKCIKEDDNYCDYSTNKKGKL